MKPLVCCRNPANTEEHAASAAAWHGPAAADLQNPVGHFKGFNARISPSPQWGDAPNLRCRSSLFVSSSRSE